MLPIPSFEVRWESQYNSHSPPPLRHPVPTHPAYIPEPPPTPQGYQRYSSSPAPGGGGVGQVPPQGPSSSRRIQYQHRMSVRVKVRECKRTLRPFSIRRWGLCLLILRRTRMVAIWDMQQQPGGPSYYPPTRLQSVGFRRYDCPAGYAARP
jgi:hypothetical protein